MKSTPSDIVLMLSGVSCVGKTSVSYNLIKNYPFFKRVSELDLIRTVLRDIVTDFSCINPTEYYQNEIDALFCSITDSDFLTLKRQSLFMQKYIKSIVKRQQDRKIPTIIEGICIVPSMYFNNFEPIDGFQKHVLFINLYLSDIDEHINRRQKRCAEREYKDNYIAVSKKVNQWSEKNKQLHEETSVLAQKTNNVFSIDVSDLDENDVVTCIIDIVQNFANSL